MGCGARVVPGGDSDSGGVGGASVLVTGEPPAEDDDTSDEHAWDPDLQTQEPPDIPPSTTLLDILVVIDNSATMGPTQEALVRGLVRLVGQLEEHQLPVDIQMMFTTTDVANPVCEQYQRTHYSPANGAPTTNGCNQRLDDFTGLGSNPEAREELCTDFCPVDVMPVDPFVAFDVAGNDNVIEGVPSVVDVDGDGEQDSLAKRAVACLAPQGINGCGYEAPLEAMLRAIDPYSPWNMGERPFLRDDSSLVIVIATDEADCSMTDYGVMTDSEYWSVNPQGDAPQASSALCWNAGVTCEGPDANGNYDDCVPSDGPLAPLSRYADYLIALGEMYGRAVRMVALTGVPGVTERDAEPPFAPVAGGIADLVVHNWRDGAFPDGDLLPADMDNGDASEELQFEFGIGPGCTVVDDASGHVARAIPNPRVNEVCAALTPGDDPDGGTHCCIESACDAIAALDCIVGWSAYEGTLLPKG